MLNNKLLNQYIIVRLLGICDYLTIWKKMRDFTYNRNNNSHDEIWILEHNEVFTQGQAGKPEHLLTTNLNIPIVNSDRGGQITFHAPGQLIAYLLIDLNRKNINIRKLIHSLEQAVIDFLTNDYQINSHRKENAPGVYVNQEKICSVGLRVRKGCCYHGLSLNVDTDLDPFKLINPCGYQNLKMTQMKNLTTLPSKKVITQQLLKYLLNHLNYLKYTGE